MPKKGKGYEWGIGKPPPKLDEHSHAKHEVVKAYLRRYLHVMFANPRRPQLKLHVIDGFCGGGLYRHHKTDEEVPGSPLLISEALADVMCDIATTRTRPPTLDAHLWLVDNNRNTMAYLEAVIQARGLPPMVTPHMQCARFDEALPGLLNQICGGRTRTPRAIFLLDQYGYQDATYQQMRQIFARVAGAEILLTFSTDALLNYLTDNAASRARLARLGLPPDEVEFVMTSAREGDVARAILAKRITGTIVRAAGASFYTSFFVKSRHSRRSFWLVHLSNQPRARDEMTKVHWEVTNHSVHHGRAGFNMLGYDPMADLGGQMLMDYCFDDDAAALTHNALMEDVPSSGLLDSDGVRYGDFIRAVSNETPGTHQHVNKALISLQQHKEIQILTKNGSTRRSASGLHETDVLRRSKQSVFSFR